MLLLQNGSSVEQRLTAAQLTVIPAEYEQLRDTKVERWRLGWQRHLVPTVLIFTDFLLSLLVGGFLYCSVSGATVSCRS